MMFTHNRLPVACALLAVLSACGRESATHLPVHAPDFSLSGSSGMTAPIARHYRVVPAGGSALTHQPADTTVHAPFVEGWARVDSQVGATSAVGVQVAGFESSPFRHSKEVVFYDSSGTKHTMFVEVEPDGPPTLQRHYREGVLVAERTQDWSKLSGGWMHDRATLTVYHDVATLTATSGIAGQVLGSAAESHWRNELASLVSLPVRLLAPRPLAAVQVSECAGEFFGYLGAMGLVDAALLWVASQPWNPRAWTALSGAIGAMANAWDTLTDCLIEVQPELDPSF